MGMTMTGEIQLAAAREAVWEKLNDPDVLKACIPGCEELEKTDDQGFRAVAKMKVGPVSARFRGKVTHANRWRLSFNPDDRAPSDPMSTRSDVHGCGLNLPSWVVVGNDIARVATISVETTPARGVIAISLAVTPS